VPRFALSSLALALFVAGASGCSPAQLVGPPPPDDASYDARVDGSAWVDDGGLPTTTAVQIIVEPSDKGAGILNAIKGAQKSIHMTMYLLTNDTLVDALIARHKAGVDVKVVLNQNFPASGTDNQPDYDKLKAAGVPVVWASPTYNYTHSKCVVIDGTTAWIMTMNLTFTSATDNREFLAIDTDPDDVYEAETVFAADFVGQTPTVPGKTILSPVNARARLERLVNEATKSIDVEAESFSDQGIEDALIAARKRGVFVRILVSDQPPSPAMAKALSDLKAAGVGVRKLATPYVHSKAIVADGALAYVGSVNFTQNSIEQNRELGIIVAEPAQVKIVGDTIAKDFAAGVAY
jgi:phosphatidylserine/phosphatidylglycerophosphate/cardiolipin synthase-like enzyme